MLRSRVFLILLIMLAALAIGISRQRALDESRRALADLAAQKAALEESSAQASSALQAAQQNLRVEKVRNSDALVGLSRLEKDLEKVDPESRWVMPPPYLPDWNSASPYIWIHKDVLARLPINAFSSSSRLIGEAATVLAITPEQEKAVNARLAQLAADYQALEAGKAVRTNAHLAGIEGREGQAITIQVPVMADDGARLKEQLQETLRREIGAQRTDLIMQVSERSLDEQFSEFGREPKTISLLRRPEGTYGIAIKSGNSWTSTDGINGKSAFWMIPANLRPRFSDILDPAVNGVLPGQ